jgi:hypothetical protein
VAVCPDIACFSGGFTAIRALINTFGACPACSSKSRAYGSSYAVIKTPSVVYGVCSKGCYAPIVIGTLLLAVKVPVIVKFLSMVIPAVFIK